MLTKFNQKVGDEIGDKIVTIFGDEFGAHKTWHQTRADLAGTPCLHLSEAIHPTLLFLNSVSLVCNYIICSLCIQYHLC